MYLFERQCVCEREREIERERGRERETETSYVLIHFPNADIMARFSQAVVRSVQLHLGLPH